MSLRDLADFQLFFFSILSQKNIFKNQARLASLSTFIYLSYTFFFKYLPYGLVLIQSSKYSVFNAISWNMNDIFVISESGMKQTQFSHSSLFVIHRTLFTNVELPWNRSRTRLLTSDSLSCWTKCIQTEYKSENSCRGRWSPWVFKDRVGSDLDLIDNQCTVIHKPLLKKHPSFVGLFLTFDYFPPK